MELIWKRVDEGAGLEHRAAIAGTQGAYIAIYRDGLNARKTPFATVVTVPGKGSEILLYPAATVAEAKAKLSTGNYDAIISGKVARIASR